MDTILILTQALNGLQLGVMLFLMAAGLTLVFGIMNLINLAHGALYMAGAYLAAAAYGWTGSFLAAVALAVAGTAALGAAIELAALRGLYRRDHLDQVLATFGLILFLNEAARLVWGPAALFVPVPAALAHTVAILPGVPYPAYRLAIIAVGVAVAGGLYLLIARTRLGMLIRAGASNRTMVAALGVDVGLLYTAVFALGAGLAALAGAMAAPILSVEPGMGEPILILTLVVIVVGGIGSIRGAFAGALLIGCVDTIGRAFLPSMLRAVLAPSASAAVGPALASMLIYLTMAVVLALRPRGLFAARTG
ncbi:MAG: branched-chain amino acid ABC transporter permease [Alphaproteobacteria bacterium]|nr:branched-chain amino acid ABC transporter permease [Alphaproteobacteria bacterium]